MRNLWNFAACKRFRPVICIYQSVYLHTTMYTFTHVYISLQMHIHILFSVQMHVCILMIGFRGSDYWRAEGYMPISFACITLGPPHATNTIFFKWLTICKIYICKKIYIDRRSGLERLLACREIYAYTVCLYHTWSTAYHKHDIFQVENTQLCVKYINENIYTDRRSGKERLRRVCVSAHLFVCLCLHILVECTYVYEYIQIESRGALVTAPRICSRFRYFLKYFCEYLCEYIHMHM